MGGGGGGAGPPRPTTPPPGPRDPSSTTALYDHYLLMSRTKTDAVTARLLTLVKRVTLTRDWLNTKWATRNGDVNKHIAEHHLQTKHQID